ncbi:glycerophosphodiester phosphodiesterase [Rubrivivax rivuli]|uniref:Glycerophosphodiester phosphodiesterase n=1 Tax=Rubrivivax rivuli TaxID=1862385 RepID=A0A437RC24_9BURK|nr:glycerophosphodiester phosphodiesterase [Rubrivivax rivuli]RVU44322.1 glycerophosphodiester phosphodiesterase [Rubrivivax rivuli]
MPPWPYPRWLAHRGAGKLAPENTLAAFRLGAAHGYRAFECDVKLSADGVPFLLHDATLERTTNGQGRAGDRPWGELALLDAGRWHGPYFAGERLPRLAEVAAWVQAQGCALNVEIKPTPGTEATTGAAVAAACAKLWAGAAVPPLLSSFSEVALQAAQATSPALPRALLLDTLPKEPVARAQALACVAVVTQHRLMDGALCTALHAAGLRALCYTVNEDADVQRLQALGVDGLITDAVDRHHPDEPLLPGR